MERVYRDQSCTWWHADGKDESVDWRNFFFLSRFVANFVNVNKEFINFFCCSDFWIPVLHVCLDWMVACKTNVWFIESDEITDEGNEGLRFFINKRYITYSYKYTHNWFLLFHKKNSWTGKKNSMQFLYCRCLRYWIDWTDNLASLFGLLDFERVVVIVMSQQRKGMADSVVAVVVSVGLIAFIFPSYLDLLFTSFCSVAGMVVSGFLVMSIIRYYSLVCLSFRSLKLV